MFLANRSGREEEHPEEVQETMSTRHYAHFPAHVARSIPLPQTHLYRNLEISAIPYP